MQARLPFEIVSTGLADGLDLGGKGDEGNEGEARSLMIPFTGMRMVEEAEQIANEQ